MPTLEVEAPVSITPQIINESRTDKAMAWKILLWNDDVNSFEHVINCLQKYLHYELDKANKTAVEVHKTGKAIVYSGHKEKCELYTEQLCNEGLNAILTQ